MHLSVCDAGIGQQQNVSAKDVFFFRPSSRTNVSDDANVAHRSRRAGRQAASAGSSPHGGASGGHHCTDVGASLHIGVGRIPWR